VSAEAQNQLSLAPTFTHIVTHESSFECDDVSWVKPKPTGTAKT